MEKRTEIEIYKNFLESLENFKKDGIIKILKRGETKKFAFERFNLDIQHNSIECFAEKLFYFGEKSKYFWEQKTGRKFLINDIGNDVFEYVFQKLNEISKIQKPKKGTLKYLEKNTHIFDYFKDNNNSNKFLNTVAELTNNEKKQLRNYYFRIIHQLGETNHIENSINLSSSEDEKETLQFSKSQITINFWDFDFNNFEFHNSNIPLFIGKPYENQKEISIFGAIFPHFIHSFSFRKKIYYNPAMFNNLDYNNAILAGFDIEQKNFEKRLKLETKYKTGIKYNDNELTEIL